MDSLFNKNRMVSLERPSDKSGYDFQAMCLIIYSEKYKSSNLTYYGSSGKCQDGIDIIGFEKNRVIGIQCKDFVKDKINFSDVEQDLSRFSEKWLFEDRLGKDYFFIVATTSKSNPNLIDKLNCEKERIEEQGKSRGVIGKLNIVIDDWDVIEEFVKSNERLRNCFIDSMPQNEFALQTAENNELRAKIVESLKGGRLLFAYNAWSDLKVKRGYEKYSDIPFQLREQLLKLFTIAGDYSQMYELLNIDFGRNPHDAKLNILYLRACRVLSATEEFDKYTISKKIELCADDLLVALGTKDEQLTLAYWVVVYAESEQTAARGLRYALSLIKKLWPSEIEFLSPDLNYCIGYDCIKELKPGMTVRDVENTKGKYFDGRAVTLAYAYSFIREIYSTRFSHSSAIKYERELGGWAKKISNWDNIVGLFDYGNFHERLEKISSVNLPFFFEEMQRSVVLGEGNVSIISNQKSEEILDEVVFFSDSLIVDIFSDCWENRMAEVSISTTNLSLEKLLACCRIVEIDKLRISERVFVGFERFINKTIFNGGDICGVGKLNYKPAYFDFNKGIPINEISAGLMLQAEKKIPLVCARIEYVGYINELIDRELVGDVSVNFWRSSFK